VVRRQTMIDPDLVNDDWFGVDALTRCRVRPKMITQSPRSLTCPAKNLHEAIDLKDVRRL
jgi:hypothetical protein